MSINHEVCVHGRCSGLSPAQQRCSQHLAAVAQPMQKGPAPRAKLGCRFVTSPGKSQGRAAGRAGGSVVAHTSGVVPRWWKPLLLQQQAGGCTESPDCGI